MESKRELNICVKLIRELVLVAACLLDGSLPTESTASQSRRARHNLVWNNGVRPFFAA